MPALGCKKTSHNSVPQIPIENENGVRTQNSVDTCDVMKILHPERQTKVSEELEKGKKCAEDTSGGCEKNNIHEMPVHELPNAELSSIKQKLIKPCTPSGNPADC